MAKKSFWQIAGGIFITGIGVAIVGIYRDNFLSLVLGFLFVSIGLAWLIKE